MHDLTCIAVSGKVPINFNEKWIFLLLGTGDAVISLICDSSESVQSQGIEKQPTRKEEKYIRKTSSHRICGPGNNFRGSKQWQWTLKTCSDQVKKTRLSENFSLREEVSLLKIVSSKQIEQTCSS